jgi:serine/threonine protein kinase
MSSIDTDELANSEMNPELTNSGQSLNGGRKKIGQYEVIRLLGRGAFGTVKLALDPTTQTYVAVKILKHRKAQNEREMEMIEREKKALMMLNHPNIVKLLEIIEDEEKQITYLVFEYVSGGELFSYIVSNGRLTETVARKFIRQIISALEYCHFNLIVHRDLKPENLLLDDANNIKITDFGLANFITPQKFSTFCGSLHYAAPEILHGQSYGGPPVDVYALGVILYCLVNGKQPFDADTPYEMIKRISTGLHFDVEVSKELKDLVHKMLVTDPKKRITLRDIRGHPWILKDHTEPPISYVPKFRAVSQIDEIIMREVVALGFEDKVSHRRAIIKNKNKQVVAAYQLCLSRHFAAPANTSDSESSPPASNSKKLRISQMSPIPEQQLRRSLSNEESDLVSARSRKSLTESQPKLRKRDSKKDNLKSSADNYDEQLDQLMCNMIRSSNETQKAIRERSQTTGRQTPEPSSTPERSRTPERSSKGRRSSISYGTPTNSPKGP